MDVGFRPFPKSNPIYKIAIALEKFDLRSLAIVLLTAIINEDKFILVQV